MINCKIQKVEKKEMKNNIECNTFNAGEIANGCGCCCPGGVVKASPLIAMNGSCAAMI